MKKINDLKFTDENYDMVMGLLNLLAEKDINDTNTGKYNTGNKNTGEYNAGSFNTGNKNTGYWNTGYWNAGNFNAGNYNAGRYNTGNYNVGNYNVGEYNAGNRNTGNRNVGNFNTGDYNTGDYNTGNWNSCDSETGFFNSESSKTIRVFNKPCELGLWLNCDKPTFIYFDIEGVKKDKESFKESYLNAKQLDNWEEQKQLLLNLPNFDKAVFFEISGIDVDGE